MLFDPSFGSLDWHSIPHEDAADACANITAEFIHAMDEGF